MRLVRRNLWLSGFILALLCLTVLIQLGVIG